MSTSLVRMIVWDVQHGNATYIRTPNGKHIVIDLGLGDYSGNNQAFSPLQTLRERYNVQTLDYVIITHPHRDHIDDIMRFDSFSPRVLKALPIQREVLLENVQDRDLPKFEKYLEIKGRYNGSVTGTSDDPTVPANYGGLSIRTFSTPEEQSLNNKSIITVIEFADIKIIIPGDNEVPSLNRLMQNDDFQSAVRNADILIAPHHGRQSAYHNDFVTLVNPRLTIVSDGSFPDHTARDRYTNKSRGWFVSDRNGTETQRYCLTTNSDGEVYINFGINNFQRILQISTL